MMEKDDTLEKLFKDFEPRLKDDDVFMRNLNRRLEAVEYLKEVQDRQLRRYKQVMLAVFVLAIVCGGLLFYFITQYADALPSLSFETSIPVLSFLAENSYIMLLSAIVLLLSYAVVSVVNLVQELWRLPYRCEKSRP